MGDMRLRINRRPPQSRTYGEIKSCPAARWRCYDFDAETSPIRRERGAGYSVGKVPTPDQVGRRIHDPANAAEAMKRHRNVTIGRIPSMSEPFANHVGGLRVTQV